MTQGERSVHLRLVGAPAEVQLERGRDVPQVFWLELTAEWRPELRPGHDGVFVPLERVLSRRHWLVPSCRRNSVGLDFDDALIAAIRRSQQSKTALNSALKDLQPLDEAAVGNRLAGTRFNRPLRGFQVRDLGHLLSLPHGANFSVPGAGKTTVEYAVYEAERAAGRVDRMLVVAPLSAFDAWESDADECFVPGSAPTVEAFGDSVSAGTEVLLVNYQRLQFSYEPLASWVGAGRTLVVLDEAHRIKRGWSGAWGSACLNLAFHAERRDVLTGTPAPQAVGDLLALIDFCWPGGETGDSVAVLDPAPTS